MSLLYLSKLMSYPSSQKPHINTVHTVILPRAAALQDLLLFSSFRLLTSEWSTVLWRWYLQTSRSWHLTAMIAYEEDMPKEQPFIPFQLLSLLSEMNSSRVFAVVASKLDFLRGLFDFKNALGANFSNTAQRNVRWSINHIKLSVLFWN